MHKHKNHEFFPRDENDEPLIVLDKAEQQLFEISCVLAIFGGILLGVIFLMICYCWKDNNYQETP